MNEYDKKIEDAMIESNDMRMFNESVKEWLRKNCAPCQRCLKIFFRNHLKDCSVIQMNIEDKFVPIKVCKKCDEKLSKPGK